MERSGIRTAPFLSELDVFYLRTDSDSVEMIMEGKIGYDGVKQMCLKDREIEKGRERRGKSEGEQQPTICIRF